MSTVCLEVSENAPPVCLFAENPNRLVSLLEMLRFNAHSFVAAFNTLGQLSMELKSGRTIPSDESFSRVGASLGLLHRECENLGLKFALVHLNRLMQTIAAGPSFRELQDGVDVTAQRIWDELDQRTYLQIDSGNLDLYNPQSPPFGQKVADSFPGAIDDVLEAGNCLALERPTAAVFHLMRVMEAALKAVAKELGIPYAPSWESYIRQLTKIIEGDWKSIPPDVKARMPFYKEILGDLQAIKIAWRNPTMHIVRSYGPEKAKKIYDSVHQFMQAIADQGLSEI